jgi:trehalose 6-phosphate phosphatase
VDSGDGGSLPPAMAVLLEEPARSTVLTDFDGTLAPIVPDPETARPLPEAPSVLAELAGCFAVVGVVSGRPLSFLARHLGAAGPAVRLYGGYGAEWRAEGVSHLSPEVEPWVPAVSEVLAAARAGAPAGLGIEDKGFALTLHWRRHPETGEWATRFAQEWAARTGLALQPGRRVIEMRPPVGPDKGTVVEQLGEGCRAVCFAGDDAGDLAAFAALDRLAAAGVAGVRLAVADEESPPQLISQADLVVEGPAGALAVLGLLAALAGGR